MQVTKIFTFAAGHRLYGYDGPCANIHGHNYRLEVTVEDNGVNAMGMVVDFAELKQRVGLALTKYDHSLILNKNDPLIEALKVGSVAGLKITIMNNNPTAENMLSDLMKSLPDDCDLNIVRLRLYETETSYAEVRK
jgi:6-pyruvoyltetrahydropterin/6-carboxytetrahydropterin synthase